LRQTRAAYNTFNYLNEQGYTSVAGKQEAKYLEELCKGGVHRFCLMMLHKVWRCGEIGTANSHFCLIESSLMLLTGRSNRKAAAENRKWRTVHLREKTEL
jgi:hypothetical protein